MLKVSRWKPATTILRTRTQCRLCNFQLLSKVFLHKLFNSWDTLFGLKYFWELSVDSTKRIEDKLKSYLRICKHRVHLHTRKKSILLTFANLMVLDWKMFLYLVWTKNDPRINLHLCPKWAFIPETFLLLASIQKRMCQIIFCLGGLSCRTTKIATSNDRNGITSKKPGTVLLMQNIDGVPIG